MIRPGCLEDREYQRNLAEKCGRVSSLIVLPTGLGKTVVALRVAAEVLRRNEGKVLFLAPTRPLVEQHAAFFREFLTEERIARVTGELRPAVRREIWDRNRVIVSTPQAVANDLSNGRIYLDEVGLIIYDEAHRGVGDYAYTAVAAAYGRRGLALGMTASPGASRRRIAQVCRGLGLEAVEARSEEDPDVSDYVHEVAMEMVEVEVPPGIREVSDQLRSLFGSYVEKLVGMGLMRPDRPPTKMYLLEVRGTIMARMGRSKNKGYLLRALSLQAMALKTAHALELAETQGPVALGSYLGKLRKEATSKSGPKASKVIVGSSQFVQANELLRETGEDHPKMEKLVDVVRERLDREPGARIIVFTNYRDSCDAVISRLSDLKPSRVGKLVGQADHGGERGLDQREQVEVLSKLRSGALNIVVATCIGEEGLDVADTDLVIFYEPVPSEIRTIQRRGRTGRTGPGRVVVLVTKGTRDEASLASSIRKEKAMRRQVARLGGRSARPRGFKMGQEDRPAVAEEA